MNAHPVDPALAIRSTPSLPAAIALLESAGLPTEDLTEKHCEEFFFSGPASAPSGLVGLEVFREVALLRSLVVTRESRSRSLGTALLEHAEAHARSRGVGTIYLLTTTAETFFSGRGYCHAERATAPADIRNTREFSGICPASSAFMYKPL